MTAPRYFLVTNDAGRCALELWCHPGNLPPSVAVVDDPDLMMKIPRGAQVRCYWYGTRATIAAWESWWMSRRLKGGFDWISEEDWARILDWADTSRKAPALKLNQGIDVSGLVATESESGGLPSRGVALRPSQPEIDPPDRFPPSAMSRASKWT